MVQHEGIAVGIGEERDVAHAGVTDVAGECDAALCEHCARRGYVLEVERNVVHAGPERPDPHTLRIDDGQGDGARLELGDVPLRAVHRAAQAEGRPTKGNGAFEVLCGGPTRSRHR